MKKLFSILLVFVMLFSFVAAETDYSSMTIEELLETISRAKSALLAKEPVEDAYVLYDRDDLKIWIDHIELTSWGSINIYINVVNDTDFDLWVWLDTAVVNGWVVDDNTMDLKVLAKSKSRRGYLIVGDIFENSDVTSFEDIESVIVDLSFVSEGNFARARNTMKLEMGETNTLSVLSREYQD